MKTVLFQKGNGGRIILNGRILDFNDESEELH